MPASKTLTYDSVIDTYTERLITKRHVQMCLREAGFLELLDIGEQVVARDYYGVGCSFDYAVPDEKVPTWGQALVAIWMRRGYAVSQSPSLKLPKMDGYTNFRLILTKEPLERFNPQGKPGSIELKKDETPPVVRGS